MNLRTPIQLQGTRFINLKTKLQIDKYLGKINLDYFALKN